MSYNPKNERHQTEQSIIKSEYSPKPKVAETFPENSRWTKQSFRDECNVNTIMARYLSTGEVPAINQTAPQYLDVSGYEFQSAQEFIAGAQTLFNELPSAVRNRFENDPAKFLDFTSNENNRLEMAQMGLLRDEVATALIYDRPIETNAPGAAPEETPPAASGGGNPA